MNRVLAATSSPNGGSNTGVIGGKLNLSNYVVSGWDSVDGILSNVTNILNWIIGFSAVVAVGLIIYAAFQFITSTGDPDKIEGAQRALTAAIIGMIIVFLARTLVIFLLGLILNQSL